MCWEGEDTTARNVDMVPDLGVYNLNTGKKETWLAVTTG
jgi:hypothetical protein